MSQMIIKDGELKRSVNRRSQMIRICPKDSKKLEYSTTNGRSWSTRFPGSSMGSFQGLLDGGNEIIAQTDKGLYYSTTKGRSWSKRG